MVIKNKYVVGCLVQFYEIEMLQEYVDSCIRMMNGIENPENVSFHFGLGLQTYLEEPTNLKYLEEIEFRFMEMLIQLRRFRCNVEIEMYENDRSFYNIAAYRRDLCWNWCNKTDFVLWGETDSLWPSQTIELIESIESMVGESTPKYIISFGYRKNWDKSWDICTHPLFERIQYEDNDEWILNNEASEKAYMNLERMNEINNIPIDSVEILEINYPKADGSCLVISSEMLRSGAVIPHLVQHCSEDEAFLRSAKMIMGENFRQYIVKNILRVHNRRHPKKRMHIANEDNPRGFCDDRKGSWWKILETTSKENLEKVRTQQRSTSTNQMIDKIKGIHDHI